MSEPAPLATARRACERLGYEPQSRSQSVDRAALLAVPTDDAVALTGAGDPATVEVHRPRPGADPHALCSTVAGAAARDRVVLFAADGDRADAVRDALADPPLVCAESETGARTFHTGADRVHLDGGGLALYVDDGRPPHLEPAFEWRETAGDAPGDRAGSDDHRLLLSVDGDPHTTLPGVSTLACPGPDRERFTHFYRREDDRLFHAYDADGDPAGVFSTVAAMRDRGFHPVPAPVVPEHLFHDAVRPPRRSWAVVDDDGAVTADAGPVDR